MGKRVGTAKWNEKEKRWRIYVQKDGKQRPFSSSIPGRKGQQEANAKADAWLDEGIENPDILVSKVFPMYKEAVALRSGYDNVRQTEKNIRLYIDPVIGHKKFSKVTENDLQRVVDRAYAKGLSRGTIKGIKGCLGSFIKFARRGRYTTLETYDLTIPKNARYKEKEIFQPKDMLVIFSSEMSTFKGKVCRDPFIHAYRYEILTGLRPGELVGMMPLNVKGKKVKLTQAINVHREVTNGKNNNALREYEMSDMAYKEYLAQLETQPFMPKDGILWGMPNQRVYRKAWERYCNYNGIKYLPPYRMRNTFISYTKEIGLDKLKEYVGHSESMPTLETYNVEVAGEQTIKAGMIDTQFRQLLQLAEEMLESEKRLDDIA